jgi:hypothetical protein
VKLFSFNQAHRFYLRFLIVCGSALFLQTGAFSSEIFIAPEGGAEQILAETSPVLSSKKRVFEFSMNVGLRQDNLNWNESDETGSINIASELTWENITSVQLGAAAIVNFLDHWSVRGKADIGRIYSGSSQDSDYNGNNRTIEQRRSNHNSGHGTVRDASIALGRTFHLLEDKTSLSLSVTPLLGLSLHQQFLTIYDGFNTLPNTGPFPNLDSSYDAQWVGQWLGFEAQLTWRDTWRFNATAEYHLADYQAIANWNLISNFAQPLSFVHNAQGTGVLLAAEAIYKLAQDWSLSFAVEAQHWQTGPGVDRTFFDDGTEIPYRINGVFWNSQVIKTGMTYQF